MDAHLPMRFNPNVAISRHSFNDSALPCSLIVSFCPCNVAFFVRLFFRLRVYLDFYRCLLYFAAWIFFQPRLSSFFVSNENTSGYIFGMQLNSAHWHVFPVLAGCINTVQSYLGILGEAFSGIYAQNDTSLRLLINTNYTHFF